MLDGNVIYGRYVHSNSCLHVSVGDDFDDCFCGQKGCLFQYLNHGALNDIIAAKVLKKLDIGYQADVVGLEWSGPYTAIGQALKSTGVRKIHHVENPDRLLFKGLRMLTIEYALSQRLKAIMAT